MAQIDQKRALVISLACIVLAVLLAMQAVSAVTSRTAPELALDFAPGNGTALTNRAFALFSDRVRKGDSVEEAARIAAPIARQAYVSEPLSPKSHMILALAQSAPDTRSATLAEALKLNRRSLPLQGAALQERTTNQDLEGVIETLDQILRVHSARHSEFFPLLARALEDDTSLPVFERILANEPNWQTGFLAHAAGHAGALVNTARLRRTSKEENPALDRTLIIRLAADPETQMEAQAHYDFAVKRASVEDAGAWRSDFPPLDWGFIDTREMRAQPDINGEKIEFFVKTGSGGGLMSRLFRINPRTDTIITVNYDIRPEELAEDVRVQAKCPQDTRWRLDRDLSEQGNGFVLSDLPEDCGFIQFLIYARAWTGGVNLRGEIIAINVSEPS